MDCLLLPPATAACVTLPDRHRCATLEPPGHHDGLEHFLHHLLAREVPVHDETLEAPVRLRRLDVARTTLETPDERAARLLGQVGELCVRRAHRARIDGVEAREPPGALL